MLQIIGVSAGYDERVVLRDISMDVAQGEIVALIGGNGSGKSTIIKVVHGLISPSSGIINFDEVAVNTWTLEERVSAGFSYMPQSDLIFPSLSVYDNLLLRGHKMDSRSFAERLEYIASLFPELRAMANRRAGTLSGGEKQILAFVGSLLPSPRLLLLDEPTLGVSPIIMENMFALMRRFARENRGAVLVAEQRVSEILNVSDRVYVLRRGSFSHVGDCESLRRDGEELRRVYF